tara:strand:+ start:211 stop:564 length:354 start_codon:yes stop_codon:yes gene_type:complete
MIERFETEQFITLKVNAESVNILQVAVDHMLEHLDVLYSVNDSVEDNLDTLVRMALITQVKQELAHKKLKSKSCSVTEALGCLLENVEQDFSRDEDGTKHLWNCVDKGNALLMEREA